MQLGGLPWKAPGQPRLELEKLRLVPPLFRATLAPNIYRVILEGVAGVEHRVLLVALAEHAQRELRRVGADRSREPGTVGSGGKDRTSEPDGLRSMLRHDFFATRQIVFRRNGRSH